jgi:hypothetical protein
LELYVTHSGSAGGPCSLSQPCNSLGRAVIVANHIAFTFTPVTINVGPGTFVTHLSFPDHPYPEASLTVIGASASATVLSGGGSGSVLVAFADAPSMTISRLTMSDARGSTSTPGGAVHDGGNIMTFDDVTFTGNKVMSADNAGGAVDDDGGNMTITDSTFTNNTAVAASTTVPAFGGAIAEQGGKLTITGSLFTGNSVKTAGSGGAIFANVGHLSVIDSTITGNSAAGIATGGAIGLNTTTSATLMGSTVNGNSSGGAGGLVAGTGKSRMSIGGDILLGNTGQLSKTCSGVSLHDLGYNVRDASNCPTGATTRVVGSDADVDLQGLAQNGGPTRTERITHKSAAHDFVPGTAKLGGTTFCGGQDQRAVPRKQGPATKCDAGSYQFAPPVITGTSPNHGLAGTQVTINGYGFVFLSLTFGTAHPGFGVAGDIKIFVNAPATSSTKTLTITIKNVDGQATTSFTVHK